MQHMDAVSAGLTAFHCELSARACYRASLVLRCGQLGTQRYPTRNIFHLPSD